MPISIIPQNQEERELDNAISSFFSKFKIGGLLRKCNAQKEKGVPVIRIFKYKMCNIFADRSMYMQQKTGSYRESFSKNTFYRFLNCAKTNGKRWQIEVFFKVCKSQLNFVGECRSLSYDALTAHVAIMFARYLMIALEQRKSNDDRTLGELFFFLVDEMADITFASALHTFLCTMFESMYAVFQITEEQMSEFVSDFVGRLPSYIANALSKMPIAA